MLRALTKTLLVQSTGTLILVCILLCPIWLAAGSALAAEPRQLLDGFARRQLVIVSSSIHCILINSYIAQTDGQRQQGLMHIRSMDLHEGMIFLYRQSTMISMWMKNTYLPLDMLFVDANMGVAKVHRNAVPHSEAIISSGYPVVAVVELNAGAAQRFGIERGSSIIFPAD